LAQRLSVLIALMAIFTLAAGAGSFWMAGAAGETMQDLGRAANVAERQTAVELGWLQVVSILDTVSITRPTADDREALTARLNELNQALDRLAEAGEASVNSEKTAENRAILADLREAYREIDGLANEIFDLAAENRWGTALQRRQSGLAQLQARLLNSLNRLNANVQGDILLLSNRIARDQALARGLAVISGVLALGVALSMFWVVRRVVTRPLSEMETQLDAIDQGDFGRVKTVERGDEIGELSQRITRLAESLRASNAETEQRIRERTQALEKRTRQVEAAARTARDIASARNLDQMLDNAVELICERFEYYHAGIFLTDARGEYQVLSAATGPAGRAMLQQGHSLRMGESNDREPTGLVGTAAFRGEPQFSAEVSHTLAHYKNPLLPETRSEVALPLKAGGRVVGVLDVQSRQPQAFDTDSLNILQIISDQIAITIQNINLLGELQRNLADMQGAYGEREREAWQRYFQGSRRLGYVYDGVDIRPVSDGSAEPQRIARPATGEPPTGGTEDSGLQNSRAIPFSVPLRVRGEEIGALEIWPRQDALSPEETYLLNAMNSRLSQILESARLYEETQSRAAREELINRLTSNIARALDLDGVLRSAAIEFGSIPSVAEASVTLLDAQSAAAQGAAAQAGPDANGSDPNATNETGSNGGGNGHRA
jgi:GAF domain-containing protein/HAMP domain-containing protein